jgi:hypothetical protein
MISIRVNPAAPRARARTVPMANFSVFMALRPFPGLRPETQPQRPRLPRR